MNNKVLLKKTTVITFILFPLLFCSCSQTNQVQREYGIDAEYFAGLKLLENGKEKEARNKFEKCAKKGSYYCARKSAEELANMGSLQEKKISGLELYQKYPDSDSLLIAVKNLREADDIHNLIELTNEIDYSSEYNEIIKLRLEAMKKQKSKSYKDDVFTWFTSRPISDYHYKFWRDSLSSEYPSFEEIEIEDSNNYNPQEFIINFRINLYKRDYTYCLKLAPKVLDYFSQGIISPKAQLASDIGKTYLYGSSDFADNGLKFKALANQYKGSPSEFYFWFYAGRCFDNAFTYYKQASISFENAINCTDSPEQKDNALWYLLTTALTYSVNSIIESIGNYSKIWSNPEYFEDFFESLSSSLLAGGKWDAFYTIYNKIDGYASDETVASYAYIYARLLEEGVANPPENLTREEAIKKSFERALKSGSAVYYKILAAYQLDKNATEIEELMCQQWANKSKENINYPAEKLLKGYAHFGYPQYIYSNYMDLYKSGISTDTCLFLADFLQKCGSEENDYFTQSLRIASRSASYGDRPLTKSELKLLYPQNYSEYIEKYCEIFKVNPSVFYALVRSESFFDARVISSAGAIGLTQIMDFTGADIAKRLKKENYSLTDAKTNIEFGVYYLGNLYRRFNNSYLQAFSSYNAGATKVRRWLKGSMIDLGKKETLPDDIFLELIPIAETREYGRKLISASVMYEWLYNTENTSKASFKNMAKNLINEEKK
ncbi:MAG: lytic transglycosylase domain-containing protein [Treponema sp.]|nr:lytic transglycosylase domain-containing protein [Treponema sp.]